MGLVLFDFSSKVSPQYLPHGLQTIAKGFSLTLCVAIHKDLEPSTRDRLTGRFGLPTVRTHTVYWVHISG